MQVTAGASTRPGYVSLSKNVTDNADDWLTDHAQTSGTVWMAWEWRPSARTRARRVE
ncbi:hypothetical protein FRAAL0864 [Frankia alni ACN14a]|uniref:Uncharacterized protein n=1 Tax=Frankia alni (strain DSM 45986 / CECT 9034 / ACN14a) TaxID=326424 RepID=Q0RSD2_FRAAA|nr:hypothetical protein FRAAL0864 [Frankia alni ACN14a]